MDSSRSARSPLDPAALQEVAGPQWQVRLYAEAGSTNELAAADPVPHRVVVADHQQAGRGRRDRTWTTPARTAVAVSVLVRPDAVPRALWSWLPLVAGLGVVDAVVRVAGLDAGLKWPNDVIVGGRKLCGVLAEVVEQPDGTSVVVGVGLNVSQRADELPVPGATSLAIEGAATTDRDTVLRSVLRAIGDRYTSWVGAAGDQRGSGIGAGYRERCRTIGARVSVELPDGTRLEGEAEGVDDEGRLVVRSADGGVQRLAAGDVVHVRPAGGASQA